MARYVKTCNVKNTANCIVYIPKKIVEAMGLTDSDTFDMLIEDGKIVLQPIKGNVAQVLQGQQEMKLGES